MPSSCEALRFSGRCFSLYSFIGMNRLPVPLFAIIAVPSPARPANVVRRPVSIFSDGVLPAAVPDGVLPAAVVDGWVLLAAVADVALVLAVLHADVLAAGRRSE